MHYKYLLDYLKLLIGKIRRNILIFKATEHQGLKLQEININMRKCYCGVACTITNTILHLLATCKYSEVFTPLYSMSFTSVFNTSLNEVNRSGKILIFTVPSAPHENMWFAGPVSICMTPVPRFLKIDCRECSLMNVWRRLKLDKLHT